MTPTIKHLQQLLIQKRDALSKIYQLTQEASFRNQTEDTDQYISLIEKREVYFSKLVAVEESLHEKNIAQCYEGISSELSKDAELVKIVTAQIKAFITDIISLDIENKKKS